MRPLLAQLASGVTEQQLAERHGVELAAMQRSLMHAQHLWDAPTRAQLLLRQLMHDPELATMVGASTGESADSSVEALFDRLIDDPLRTLLVEAAQGQTIVQMAWRRGVDKGWVTHRLAKAISRIGARSLPDAIILAGHTGLISKVSLGLTPDSPPPDGTFTDWDRQLFRLLLAATPRDQLHHELKASRGVVKGRIAQLKREWGAKTRPQLVTIAFARGWMTPEELELQPFQALFSDLSAAYRWVAPKQDLQLLILSSMGGLTRAEIAKALGLRAVVVQRRLQELYYRFGARGDADALILALRHRLLSPELVEEVAHLAIPKVGSTRRPTSISALGSP